MSHSLPRHLCCLTHPVRNYSNHESQLTVRQASPGAHCQIHHILMWQFRLKFLGAPTIKGKSKGKDHPGTGHEGREGE